MDGTQQVLVAFIITIIMLATLMFLSPNVLCASITIIYNLLSLEVSSDLITHLQERDDLLLQKHTMKVTAGQLVDLQSNLKTTSTQNLQRPAPDTRNNQDTLHCK